VDKNCGQIALRQLLTSLMQTSPVNGNGRRRILRAIPVFQGLSQSQLDKVASAMRKVAAPRGTRLLKQGEPGGAFYVILSGSAEVRHSESDNREEKLVTILKPGQAFGEIALLVGDEPRAASVVVSESGILLVMTRQDWEQLLFVDKDIGHHVLWSLARMLATRLRQIEPEALPVISTVPPRWPVQPPRRF